MICIPTLSCILNTIDLKCARSVNDLFALECVVCVTENRLQTQFISTGLFIKIKSLRLKVIEVGLVYTYFAEVVETMWLKEVVSLAIVSVFEIWIILLPSVCSQFGRKQLPYRNTRFAKRSLSMLHNAIDETFDSHTSAIFPPLIIQIKNSRINQFAMQDKEKILTCS